MSNNICKKCNEENHSNSLYCQKCGIRLINNLFYEKIKIMGNSEVAENKLTEDKQEQITDFSQIDIKIKFSDDSNFVKEYNEERFYPILKESIMLNYNFSDEVKKGLIQDLIDGMEKQLMPYYRARNMSKRLNGNMELSEKIEHEETMRGANLSSWIQGKVDKLIYFTVDFCSNESCINKYKYTYFDIDDIEEIPPLYPDCGCVPVFHFDEEDAETYGREISEKNCQEYNEEKRKQEEPYATGYIAFDLAEKKMYSLKKSEAEKNQYLDLIPLLNRALKDDISSFTKANVYRMMGDVYFKNGDNDLAVTNYEKALSYNPKVGIKRLYDKLKKE